VAHRGRVSGSRPAPHIAGTGETPSGVEPDQTLEHDLAIAWAVVIGIALSAWISARRFIVALDPS
jgi:hypothetical protein